MLGLSKTIADRSPSFSNESIANPMAGAKPSSSVAITDNSVGSDDLITNNDSTIEHSACTKKISSSAANSTTKANSAPNKTVASSINNRSTIVQLKVLMMLWVWISL